MTGPIRKLGFLAVVVATFCASASALQADADPSSPPPSPPCSSTSAGLDACGGSGRITVGGTQAGSGGDDENNGQAHMDPVGSIRLVPCGDGAAARFAAAGDADPAYDAKFCDVWGAQCIGSLATPDATIAAIRLEKRADGSWRYNGQVCIAPAKPVVTVAAVRERVVRLIPSAAVGLAPKVATLVNIETVVWVAAPVTRTLPMVPILGQHLVISLKVDHVVYDFGDGTDDRHGPVGKAYDAVRDPCRTRDCADYYGHVYTVTGIKTVTATVFWRASFTVNGGQVQQVPGVVPGPEASATVRVREARAVLIPNS